jgi:hypothetical protein
MACGLWTTTSAWWLKMGWTTVILAKMSLQISSWGRVLQMKRVAFANVIPFASAQVKTSLLWLSESHVLICSYQKEEKKK